MINQVLVRWHLLAMRRPHVVVEWNDFVQVLNTYGQGVVVQPGLTVVGGRYDFYNRYRTYTDSGRIVETIFKQNFWGPVSLEDARAQARATVQTAHEPLDLIRCQIPDFRRLVEILPPSDPVFRGFLRPSMWWTKDGRTRLVPIA